MLWPKPWRYRGSIRNDLRVVELVRSCGIRDVGKRDRHSGIGDKMGESGRRCE